MLSSYQCVPCAGVRWKTLSSAPFFPRRGKEQEQQRSSSRGKGEGSSREREHTREEGEAMSVIQSRGGIGTESGPVSPSGRDGLSSPSFKSDRLGGTGPGDNTNAKREGGGRSGHSRVHGLWLTLVRLAVPLALSRQACTCPLARLLAPAAAPSEPARVIRPSSGSRHEGRSARDLLPCAR